MYGSIIPHGSGPVHVLFLEKMDPFRIDSKTLVDIHGPSLFEIPCLKRLFRKL